MRCGSEWELVLEFLVVDVVDNGKAAMLPYCKLLLNIFMYPQQCLRENFAKQHRFFTLPLTKA